MASAKYVLCNLDGTVHDSTPQKLTIEEANQRNTDFHKQSYPFVWVKTWRIEDGKVAFYPNGQPITKRK